MRVVFLYLTVISGILAAVSQAAALFGPAGRGSDETIRGRTLFLSAATLSVFAELYFAFDTGLSGKRVDGTYLLFHLSVLLPFLGCMLALLVRYARVPRNGSRKVSADRAWLLVPVPAVLVAAGNFLLPYRLRIGLVSFTWYAVSYSLVVLLVLRAAGRSRAARRGPIERCFSLLLAGTFALDLFFPWNRPVRDLLGTDFSFSIIVLAAYSAAQLPAVFTGRSAPGLEPAKIASGMSDRFGLSPRETEVALYVREGKTNREIAELMFISLPTVKKHLANLFEKTGSRNRVELVRKIF